MLPQVQITFANGALGQTAQTADGVFGLITQGVPLVDETMLHLATPYVLYSLDDLVALGVKDDGSANASIYKDVKEFYDNSANGTELWLIVFPQSLLLSDLVDKTKNTATALLQSAKGRLRAIGVSFNPDSSYDGSTANGMDEDVATAISNAQALGEWATDTLHAPIITVLEGYNYQGNAVQLADLTTQQNNRVSVLIGDTIVNSKKATIGTLLGRAAYNPLQNKIARVRDGAVQSPTMFIKDKAVELADVNSIDAKGYITFLTYSARTGYFFVDDWTATLPTDDYVHIVYRRTIDKAYRIAYDTLLNYLQDTVPCNSDGTVQVAYARIVEAAVENAIISQMTANGQLSPAQDGTDSGVLADVDLTKNIYAGNPFTITIQVRPFGYNRMIKATLGFTLTTAAS